MAIVSTRTTGPFNLLVNEDLTVERTGTIRSIAVSTNAINGSDDHLLTLAGTVLATGATSNGVALTGGNNRVDVAATGLVSGTANGISIAGNSNTLNLSGTVLGQFGLLLGGAQNTVNVLATGNVEGSLDGMHLNDGGNIVSNLGTVAGGIVGIFVAGGGNQVTNGGTVLDGIVFAAGGTVVGQNQLTNNGTIHGPVSANDAVSAENGLFFVATNSGTINGLRDDGISVFGNTVGSNITNTATGFIIAANRALQGSDFATDTIVNNGYVEGGNFAVRLNGGNDSFDGTNGIQVGIVAGDAGNDTIRGGAGVDTIEGGADNDTLFGNGGADSLSGGTGNDTFDLAGEATGVDTLTDTSGTDTILSTITRSLFDYTMIEHLTLQGSAQINGVGNNGNNTLIGNGALNALNGGTGNDSLFGQGGADILNGGPDNDIYNLGTDLTDTISDASGIDGITSTVTRSLVPYASIENLFLQGASAINATGNALANVIEGNGANNQLMGGAQNDVLKGHGGTDAHYGEGDNDTFRFLSITDSAVGSTRDVIFDLDDLGGDDVVDLSLVAGVTTFIGSNPFANAGEVRIQQAGANVLVQINTVGTGTAESEILIANATIGVGAGQVDAGDFLL